MEDEIFAGYMLGIQIEPVIIELMRKVDPCQVKWL
jgi:hypothetical protein